MLVSIGLDRCGQPAPPYRLIVLSAYRPRSIGGAGDKRRSRFAELDDLLEARRG